MRRSCRESSRTGRRRRGAVRPGPRHAGWALAPLAFAQLIFSLDINIVFVALPRIGAELGFSEQSLQWVVSAYVVFAGGFLLLGGRAADLLGRRRMFVLALTLYAVSSLVGGLARDADVMIAARAVQGIGAALLLPSTLSLINTLYAEGRPRNRALAVWGGAGASGLTLGALLGGLLTESFGWSAVFFVNVPLAGLVVVAALVVIPRDTHRGGERRFDLPGALTATGGATLLVYALVQGPEAGWTAPSTVAAAVLAVVLLAAFAWIEVRTPDPLTPPRLLRNRTLVVGMTVTFVFMGTFGAVPYFLTVFFQRVQGLTALQTGLAFLVPSVMIAAGTQLGERLVARVGTRTTLLVGFGSGVVGAVVLAPGIRESAGYAGLLPGLVVLSLGHGAVWTAMWIAAASGVTPREHGVASGLASSTLNIGNAVGLAVLVAVGNLVGGTGDVASGNRTALVGAAVGMLIGLLVTLALPRAGARHSG